MQSGWATLTHAPTFVLDSWVFLFRTMINGDHDGVLDQGRKGLGVASLSKAQPGVQVARNVRGI